MPITVRWFPPAWVQFQSAGKVVYVDPAYLATYFARYPKKAEFSKWPEPADGMPDGLAPADAVLVTHAHPDHCKWLTIRRLLGHGTQIYAPAACAAEISARFNRVKEGDEFQVGGVQVKATAAYNLRAEGRKEYHHRGRGVGYLLTAEKRTAYVSGDSDFVPEMKGLGKVHVALLPIGGKYTMGVDDAVAAASAIAPKIAVPTHWLAADPEEFRKKMAAAAPKARVVVAKAGKEIRFR